VVQLEFLEPHFTKVQLEQLVLAHLEPLEPLGQQDTREKLAHRGHKVVKAFKEQLVLLALD
jgi:hypothetical protein